MIRRTAKALLAGLGLLDRARRLRAKVEIICDHFRGYTNRFIPYNFKRAKKEWVRIPIDDFDYLSSEKLLLESEQELIDLAERLEKTRYDVHKLRNHKNLWRIYSGMDEISGKKVLDFGCGFGVESLQFARRGNKIYLADINQSSIDLAERVLRIYGFKTEGKFLVGSDYPFFTIEEKIDIFYSNGVLHHTPKFREILKRAAEILSEDGEIRLMLYSDVSWTLATKTDPPPIEEDVRTNPNFRKFVRYSDFVGDYANWYNKEKIEYLVGDFLRTESLNYITSNRGFLMGTFKVKKRKNRT